MNILTYTQRNFTAKFFAILTVVSMLLSALPVAFFVAQAADTLYGPIDDNVTAVGGEHASGDIDASVYENLVFSFDYDSTALDGEQDSFTYGWRDGSGDNYLGKVDGLVGTTATEIDSVSVALQEIAQVSDLEVYIYVIATPGNESDVVKLTNITVKGDLKDVPVYGCMDEKADNFNSEASEQGENDCEYPDSEEATVISYKIICDDESYLPDWGPDQGVPTIGVNTVSDFLSEGDNDNHCEAVQDWKFQWAPPSTSNPGDNNEDPGDPWTTFTGSIDIEIEDGWNHVWMRELPDSDYIPFTGNSDLDPISAEFYCGTDSYHYDNYDRIDGITDGETYYCVGFNVLKEREPQECTLTLVSDTDDFVVETDDSAKELSFIHSAWTAIISGATWIWGDDPIVDPAIDETQTFVKNFGWAGTVDSATLYVASDNSHRAEINSSLAGDAIEEKNFRITDQDEYDVSSLINQGNNELSIAVKNWASNEGPEANPAGLLYKLEITTTDDVRCDPPYEPEPEDPEYGPYCGDGVVNQDWEQCDGTDGCTEQCQNADENQCTDLTLAKIDMAGYENKAGGIGDMTDDIFLGQSGLAIPNDVWFLVHSGGVYENDADIAGYEDVPGLAVQRLDGSVRSVMYGSNTGADEEHVNGTVEFWSWDDSVEATAVLSDNSGNNKLEGDFTDGSGIGNTNAGDDEVSVSSGVANFWLTTTTADDGFFTEYSEPVVCDACEDELDGAWSDFVEGYSQGDKRNSNPITDVNRTDPNEALGEEDWDSGDSTGFFSLGFGGWIEVGFDTFVPNVVGNDISIHEATNGTYPAETALVEVSQNGSDWYEIGTADNSAGDKVTYLDISDASVELTWIKYVRVTDTSNPALFDSRPDADGFDLDAVDATQTVCDMPDDPEPEREMIAIHTYKLVCTVEADLPNWGAGGPDITPTTASVWASEHDSCELVDGWEFEWGPENVGDPGDTLVGTAGGGWTTFTGTTNILFSEVEDNDNLWMREVLKDDYLTFTHGPNGELNSDDYTAEFYCHTDVKNYDNYDRIDDIEADGEYYCVAWNVPTRPIEPKMCLLDIVSDTGTVVVENNTFAVETYTHPNWTADIGDDSDAEWVWESDKVIDPEATTTLTFKETFEVTSGTNALLEVAADNSYKAWLNGDLVIDESDEGNNFNNLTQDDEDITSYLVDGTNTLLIEVTNHPANGANYAQNPAGVMYRLTLDGDENSCDVTTDTEEEQIDYTLTIQITGDGSGEVFTDQEGILCTSDGGDGDICEMTYSPDTVVDLTADAYEGSNFDNSWTAGFGTCTGNTSPCQVTMTQDVDLIAHFDLNTPTITTTSGGGGGGGGTAAPRCDLFELDNGVLSWDTRNGRDLTIEADGTEIFSTTDDDEVDEGSYSPLVSAFEYELTVFRGTRTDTCTIQSGGQGGANPAPLVLGEQVSAVPYGAPDAGAGGASPVQIPSFSFFQVTATLLRKG